MSTRWYPLYHKGNPQLRVFLPNFWLKLVEPTDPSKHPPNVVQFHCHMKMTKFDVKNYLEKIYNVKTVDVRTRIQLGKTKRRPSEAYVVKENDYKVAYAILPKDQSFVFPDILDKAEQEKEEKFDKQTFEEMKKGHKEFLKRNNKPGVPGWFSI